MTPARVAESKKKAVSVYKARRSEMDTKYTPYQSDLVLLVVWNSVLVVDNRTDTIEHDLTFRVRQPSSL